MIEKDYQKKILPYLDGALTPQDRAEFEAFVATHPEFETQLKDKQNEVAILKDLMPMATLSGEALEALESEIKESVFNLLKEEPKNFWGSLKNRYEEWINR